MDQLAVSGSMFSFEVSKFSSRDADEPSGLVTPPIHAPVSGSGVAEGKGVGVDEGAGKAVGTALCAAHAVRQRTNRRVRELMRMEGSIFQAALILTTLRRGIKDLGKRKVRVFANSSKVGMKRITSAAIKSLLHKMAENYSSAPTGVTIETAFGRILILTGRYPITSPSPCTGKFLELRISTSCDASMQSTFQLRS
jgi:hypothetical protein